MSTMRAFLQEENTEAYAEEIRVNEFHRKTARNEVINFNTCKCAFHPYKLILLPV